MITYKDGRAYDSIQRDVELCFSLFIGKTRYEVENICIVGAYHGYEINRLLELYPNSVIYAFEAHPKHFAVLKSRFLDNPRVKFRQAAVSNSRGKCKFFELNYEGSGSILEMGGDKTPEEKVGWPVYIEEVIEVDSYLLSDLVGDIKFDLLWVDVQGAELMVLQGSNLDNFESMFLEVHTKDFIKPWDNAPYLNQCHLEDLECFLKPTHKIHSIGLDNECFNGQGNSFWLKNKY